MSWFYRTLSILRENLTVEMQQKLNLGFSENFRMHLVNRPEKGCRGQIFDTLNTRYLDLITLQLTLSNLI